MTAEQAESLGRVASLTLEAGRESLGALALQVREMADGSGDWAVFSYEVDSVYRVRVRPDGTTDDRECVNHP